MWRPDTGVTSSDKSAVWRIALLVLLALALGSLLWAQGPMPQSAAYLRFVDHRTLLGVPNACNVLSNLAFALVGIAGVWLLATARARLRDRGERAAWIVFFVAVALTSVGSSFFHLAPTIESLVWDRLPMAVAFMALFCALLAERIDAMAGALLLPPLALAGIGSVALWWWSERAGAGDLRPYLFVQFYPLLAIPLVLILFPARYSGSRHWLVALGCYGFAKLAELADDVVFQHARVVSGHTVKHLLAAAGIGVLAWMLASRRASAGIVPTSPPHLEPSGVP